MASKKFLSNFASKRFKILCLLAFWIPFFVYGAYLLNFPQTLKQPDGQILHCFASGDEFYNWLHDADGYTIIQHPVTGFYMYAANDAQGNVVPTNLIAGRANPALFGLAKGVKRSAAKIAQEVRIFIQNEIAANLMPAPKTGQINNIVIFIRFQGESEFGDAIATYDGMFNASVAGANSMHNYFHEASYNALSITSSFYPTPPGATVVSYQDGQPRGYYQPYSATNTIGYTGGDNGTQRRDREHTLLKSAVNAVSSQVPPALVVDGDGDGNVDNVCFIVSGGPTGWASLLWPHMWSLYSQTATINSKRVYTYNFQLHDYLGTNNNGVLCHEMFHSLGSPDLYHYTGNGINPVYTWDLMEYNQNPPQHMGAYMKYKYGTWISSIPEITTSGTYLLNPLTSAAGNIYKIIGG
ncbi:MAG: M6 family metalloprotease domain-containing protein [Candidatus Aminicenantes bacterium]|nr:M6 family metalloprotease domain-containing protein [Candidatus Aminicenantes bacterium]